MEEEKYIQVINIIVQIYKISQRTDLNYIKHFGC